MKITRLEVSNASGRKCLVILGKNINLEWGWQVSLLVLISMYASMAVAWLAALFPVYPLSESGAMLLLGTVMICFSVWGRKMLNSQGPRSNPIGLEAFPADAWAGNQSSVSSRDREVMHADATRI